MEKTLNSASKNSSKTHKPYRAILKQSIDIYIYTLKMSFQGFAKESESVLLYPSLSQWEIISTRFLVF